MDENSFLQFVVTLMCNSRGFCFINFEIQSLINFCCFFEFVVFVQFYLEYCLVSMLAGVLQCRLQTSRSRLGRVCPGPNPWRTLPWTFLVVSVSTVERKSTTIPAP